MSDEKKGKLVVVLLGVAMLIIGALTIVYAAKTRHYTATVTEITNTKSRSGSKSKRKYYEWVTVTYKDDSGTEKTAEDVRLKRSVESSLPKVGDTIEVKGTAKITEYSIISYIGTAATLIIVGLVLLIRGLTYKPKPVEDRS